MVLNIADKIKYLRDKYGMTQTYLAKRLGISRSAVNSWEMSMSLPSLSNVVEMTRIFNVSSDYLLGVNNQVTLDITDLTNEERETLMKLVQCLKNK
jgi:transcriptional regulator with XRE-family HTH domain